MALRLASSSLARRLLTNRVGRSYTNLAAVEVGRRNGGVCAAHENGRRELNTTMNRQFKWRFMATSAAQEQEDDDDDHDNDADIDLEVHEANER